MGAVTGLKIVLFDLDGTLVEGSVLLKGVRELLGGLWKQDAAIGLVTGYGMQDAIGILESAGIRGYFPVIVGIDMGRGIEERLARALDACRKRLKGAQADIYYFDDSGEGIPVSRRLGITSFAIGTGVTPLAQLRDMNPDYALKDLGDTKKILGIIFA